MKNLSKDVVISLLDSPALVFKTLADVIKRETYPNSDEECKWQDSQTKREAFIQLLSTHKHVHPKYEPTIIFTLFYYFSTK